MIREPCRVGPFLDAGAESADRTATGTVDRVEHWRDMLRDHFVALDVSAGDAPFDGAVRSTLVGHVSAAQVTSGPQSCVRTPSLAHADGESFLQVGMLARGRAVVCQDGRETALEPGRFVLYESDRPFAWHFPGPWTLYVLTWPRRLVDLGADVTRAASARPLGGDRLGEIVGRTLAETVLSPPALTPAGARQLAGELSALVGLAAGEQVRRDETLSRPGAEELRHRVDRYVLDHLDDPDLGPETIARAHFVSVRGLHRAFAGAGLTVGALIRRRRLEQARHRLVDPRNADRSITAIAHDCGFADLPAFSRRFKVEYHESPDAYRRRGGLGW